MCEATPLHFTFSKRKSHLLSAEFKVSFRLSLSCVCQSVSVAMDSVVCLCVLYAIVCVCWTCCCEIVGSDRAKRNWPFVSFDSNF